MNYLAHMFLSCTDSHQMTGNFMADFITNKEVKTLPETIQKGIELHKKIDHFTDNNDEVRKTTRLFYPTQSKYAPVVVDILFDYFLTKNWDSYSSIPIVEFVNQTYVKLAVHEEHFPTRLKTLFPKMVADDFLMSCKNEERLVKTLTHVSKRAKFQNRIHTAFDDMQIHYERLDQCFNTFFPALITEVNQFCQCE
jgi:acyl carrier protein phosphodiesterase